MNMKYTNLGNTGLQISRLCLGCMSYGDSSRGGHQWTLDEDASRPFIRKALESGINFFDTANAYSHGSSEEILGRALKDFANRDEVVVATKAYFFWRRAPNAGGLSRKALFESVDASLRRLDMEYIDLLQIHRWDYNTPIEETLEALTDLVRSGKVHYIGASSMYAYQFMRALCHSRQKGLASFVSMQNHYNLLYREEEREMLRLCREEKIAVIPWSPLARGKLTRDWDAETNRSRQDAFSGVLFKDSEEADKLVVQAVRRIASERGVPMAQVALAWLLHKPAVTSPIIGATRLSQLDDAVAAVGLDLSREEIDSLESPYVPHAVKGLAQRLEVPGSPRVKNP